MQPFPILPRLALVLMMACVLVLTGCGGGSNNTINVGGTTAIFPAVNPVFDEITALASSPAPAGPYQAVNPDLYNYDPVPGSIVSRAQVASGGEYVRITGLATLTGAQNSYTVYTYIARRGDRVAANELTSAAVGLVAAGDAADFEKALGLVETEYGLPAGSVADPAVADERSAQLTSVLAALAPAFAADADPAFDVTSFTAADLADDQAGYLDCIVLGALAWDSWHKSAAGGSGLPTDEGDADYTRCKACHGWDQQGTDGGYDQRDRNAGRANAGYQDPNNCDRSGADPLTCTPSRNISTDATFGWGAALEIPAGGRIWAEGSAVFDMIDPEWGPGAILGNRHPDLGPDNPEGPSAQQLSCLTAFLNAPIARADQVYAAIDTMPADGDSLNIYTPVAAADAVAGEVYYGANCQGCHGEPSDDSTGVTDDLPGTGGMIGYLNKDGKFSEFMHKMHWGIPDTIMDRAAMGDPAAADVADVVAFLQAVPFMELSAAQEVPAIAGIMARGSGMYTLTEAGLEYSITVDTASLSGAISAAHFHLGRVGTNGGVVRTISFTNGQAIGIWTSADDEPLTPEVRQALLDGNIYVNVHTAANPSGEIRGQVRAVQGGGNQPPVAAIAVDPAINVAPDTLVTLDGSGSSDPDAGPALLTYVWTLEVPAGSAATLSDPADVSPTFTADVEGDYLATLTVNDGLADDTADVTVTALAGNLPPVADAGPDQNVETLSEVTLDGSGSSDPDAGPAALTYAWTLDSVPAGSTATLANANTASPTFTADLDGTYTVTLVVNDGEDDSAPDSVIITARAANVPPVADAGADQDVDTGSEVTLDGSGSSDPDAGPAALTYAWTLDSVPAGSTAMLANADTASPTFTADLDGTYTATLVVNDGLDDSVPDSMTVTATPGLPEPTPSELAGRDQYDAECTGCHSAPDWDNSGETGTRNLTRAGAQPVVADLTIYSGAMGGVSPLTDQEVIDLNAFLNGICVQVPAQCQ